ncbi:Signal transduction histidine kinase with GAF [Candidatus Magnetobacterium bavaricum]|uniref:Signal transduction histidine kinase with GAF n=1 Tax=Candidatus Magnetobacterium bavaricum TaxID=29290 RepID=A0A0F3GI05_9BACT|nr:Signal transduction histidine kinase with GAF [Candidatus Magnetobacterium bavaricum]
MPWWGGSKPKEDKTCSIRIIEVRNLPWNIDSFDELMLSIREILNKFIKNNFEYEIWFYDKFEDNRGEVLSLVHQSKVDDRRRKRIYCKHENDNIICKSYSDNEIVYADKNKPDELIGYKEVIYLPINFQEEKIGVLGVLLYEELDNESTYEHVLKDITMQFFLLIKVYYSSVSVEITRTLRDIHLETGIAHKDFISQVLKVLKEKMTCEGCSLFLFDNEYKYLYLEGTMGFYNLKGENKSCSYFLGEGLTGWVAGQKNSLRIYNAYDRNETSMISDDFYNIGKYDEAKTPTTNSDDLCKSYLAIPIFEDYNKKDKLIGVIRFLRNSHGKGFLRFEEVLAANVAEFLTLYYSEYWNNQQKEDLLFINKTEYDVISKAIEKNKMLKEILDKMSDITNTNDSYIALYDKKTNTLSTHVTCGKPLTKRPAKKECCKGIVGTAIEQKKIICTNTYEERNIYETNDFPLNDERERIMSELAVPIIFNDEVLGVVNLHSNIPYMFKSRDISRIKLLVDASSIIIAINFRYIYIFEEFNSLINVLENIGSLTTDTADIRDLYNLVLNDVKKIAKAKCFSLIFFFYTSSIVRDIDSIHIKSISVFGFFVFRCNFHNCSFITVFYSIFNDIFKRSTKIVRITLQIMSITF